MTSSAYDADLKGNNFRCAIYPLSFISVVFIFSELDWRGGGGGGGGERGARPVQQVEKKAGLNRITG